MSANGYGRTCRKCGTIERGYERVRDGFAEGAKDDEGGGQLCVYRHGKKVVDLSTGTDTKADRPYTGDLLTVIMSCTKGVTATAAHMLVMRGKLDPEARVTKYWPEFGAAGKEDMRVYHLFAHTRRDSIPSIRHSASSPAIFSIRSNAPMRSRAWSRCEAGRLRHVSRDHLRLPHWANLCAASTGAASGGFVAEEISGAR